MRDVCQHCETPLDEDDQMWALATPPGSRVAGVIVTCSSVCVMALRATGWRNPTPEELDRLHDQANRYGRRVGS